MKREKEMSRPKGDYTDIFSPPRKNITVRCLHCGRTYKVWEMRYSRNGGFWLCKYRDCDGVGYGFDILPKDADLSIIVRKKNND